MYVLMHPLHADVLILFCVGLQALAIFIVLLSGLWWFGAGTRDFQVSSLNNTIGVAVNSVYILSLWTFGSAFLYNFVACCTRRWWAIAVLNVGT
jgi:hypothetical protein